MNHGQTAFEYLLMVAGGILLASLLMVIVSNNLNLVSGSINMTDYTWRLNNYLSTASYPNDGDWIIAGNDEFSGVPGNVGVGLSNPQSKFEVVGSSKFNGQMSVSDNRITDLAPPLQGTDAVNKDYVDALGGGSANATCNLGNSSINVSVNVYTNGSSSPTSGGSGGWNAGPFHYIGSASWTDFDVATKTIGGVFPSDAKEIIWCTEQDTTPSCAVAVVSDSFLGSSSGDATAVTGGWKAGRTLIALDGSRPDNILIGTTNACDRCNSGGLPGLPDVVKLYITNSGEVRISRSCGVTFDVACPFSASFWYR
jgi:hypothetical protein